MTDANDVPQEQPTEKCEVCGGEAWIQDYDADDPDPNLWWPCWLCSNCRRPEVRP